METAKPGVSVLSLCEKGDAYIMTETGKVFKKEKEMKKGETKMASLCPGWVWLNAGGFVERQLFFLEVVSNSRFFLLVKWWLSVTVSVCWVSQSR